MNRGVNHCVTPLNADLTAIDDCWERESPCASGIWPMRDYSGPVRWFYTHVNVGSTKRFS